jgi:predicted permease
MVAQVALSLVLVVMAVLFSRTLLNLQRVDVGFDPSRLSTFVLEPARSGYTRERAMEFYAQLDERLRRVPGVRAVTIAGSGSGMLWGTDSAADVYLDGADAAANRDGAKWQFVELNFFETVGIRVRRGRGFTPQDTAASTPVAVVTESFARAFFGNHEPLGRHFAGQAQAPTARQIEIVGIVSDSKVHSLRQDSPPIYYRPLAQTGSPTRTVVVRTVGEPEALLPAIADAVRQLDSRLPIRNLMTQQQHLERYVRDERTFAIASSFFGSVSLAISMIGLFGLMSYAVARRTREIGVRMALGAAPARVLTTVMGETLLVVAIGVAIGVGAAAATGRFVASFMFGLAPTDPASIAGSAFLMLSVAAFAGYLPARRASRVDPLVALRSE